MRPLFGLVILTGLVAAPVKSFAAEPLQCTKGNDARMIEVLTPGEVGKACDLKYTRENGQSVSVPYHANNNVSFCAAKADELIGNLTADGFSCGAVSAPIAATTLPALAASRSADDTIESSQDNVVKTAIAEASASVAAITEAPEKIVSDNNVAEKSSIETSLEAIEKIERSTTPDPVTATVDSVRDQGEARLVQLEKETSIPSPVTSSAPVDLTAEATPTARKAPRPVSSSAGRVVGAAPDPTRIAKIEQAEARADAGIASSVVPVVASVESQAINAAITPDRPLRIRPAPAIIKGVLGAQVAAWNEGNLEAFMAGYWKDRDLRFVSGTDVTTGWTQTLKRYQKKYAGENMGVLAFEKLDVQMLTDEVAVIVGRFNLDRKGTIDTGGFTLVMQQFEGRWRIVHDHTVGDAPAEVVDAVN